MVDKERLSPKLAKEKQTYLLNSLRARFADWEKYLGAGGYGASVEFVIDESRYTLCIYGGGPLSIQMPSGDIVDTRRAPLNILVEATKRLPALEECVLTHIEKDSAPAREALKNFPKPRK